MTERVCTVSALDLDTRLLEPMLDDGMQRSAPGKRTEWRPRSQEDFAHFGLWPAVTQILQ